MQKIGIAHSIVGIKLVISIHLHTKNESFSTSSLGMTLTIFDILKQVVNATLLKSLFNLIFFAIVYLIPELKVAY